MRNTRNWKHNTKNRKQYTAPTKAYFDPFLFPVSYYGMNKRNTEFMDLSDIDEEEEDEV